jgi:hypothetical protein
VGIEETKAAWAMVNRCAGTGQAGGSRVGLGTRPGTHVVCRGQYSLRAEGGDDGTMVNSRQGGWA